MHQRYSSWDVRNKTRCQDWSWMLLNDGFKRNALKGVESSSAERSWERPVLCHAGNRCCERARLYKLTTKQINSRSWFFCLGAHSAAPPPHPNGTGEAAPGSLRYGGDEGNATQEVEITPKPSTPKACLGVPREPNTPQLRNIP